MKKIILICLFNYLFASDNHYSIIITNSSNESNITINGKRLDTNSSNIVINGKNIDLNNTIIKSETIIKNGVVIGNTGVYIGK